MRAAEPNQQSEASDLRRAEQTEVARDERLRMVVAARELENALASASWHREVQWKKRVRDALAVLRTALKVTREAADSEGSLLSEVIQQAPRLELRVNRLRDEYDRLQRHVDSLQEESSAANEMNDDRVDQLRQRVGRLITSLQNVQAKESELLYEAFQVDVGIAD